MRRAILSLLALLVLSVAAPVASAQCSLGVDEICEPAEAMFLDEAFGQYADIALIVLALFVLALVLNMLVWVARRLKPSRLLRVTAGEKVREVEPGGTVKYKLDIENAQTQQPIDVFIEHDGLPAGWDAKISASVNLPSGFRLPHDVGEMSSFTLSSAARGSNTAIVEVRATAPKDVTVEETVETEVRVVPVVKGRVKKGAAKKAHLTLLLVPHLPKVQILKVTHRPDRISIGNPVLTTATVVNKGEREAHDVAVSFSLNGSEMDKKVVPALAVQGAADVEFNWTPQTGENKIRVAVAT